MARLDGHLTDAGLWGVHEIAQELGISRATVYYHVREGNFPEPYVRLAMGPVWWAADVRAWRQEGSS